LSTSGKSGKAIGLGIIIGLAIGVAIGLGMGNSEQVEISETSPAQIMDESSQLSGEIKIGLTSIDW
jgi:ABC-type nitrate/sulfonate/bicarbonate transport system permease component